MYGNIKLNDTVCEEHIELSKFHATEHAKSFEEIEREKHILKYGPDLVEEDFKEYRTGMTIIFILYIC